MKTENLHPRIALKICTRPRNVLATVREPLPLFAPAIRPQRSAPATGRGRFLRDATNPVGKYWNCP